MFVEIASDAALKLKEELQKDRNLKLAISKFTDFYEEISEIKLLLEIPRLRSTQKPVMLRLPIGCL